MSTRPISAKLPEELYERLSAAAERGDRSMSWITAQALQNYLDEDEAIHEMTLAALADVDAGRTMDDDELDARMEGEFGPAPTAAGTD